MCKAVLTRDINGRTLIKEGDLILYNMSSEGCIDPSIVDG